MEFWLHYEHGLPLAIIGMLLTAVAMLFVLVLVVMPCGRRETLICPHCGKPTLTGSQTCRACGGSFRDRPVQMPEATSGQES